VLNDLGYFHYRHGRMKLAEEALRSAVKLNPRCQCAWINLGQVLACEGRVEESYQAFARVLRPAEAYSNVGVLLARQGRTAEARSALQRAAALDPTLEQPQAFLSALPSTPSGLPEIARGTPSPVSAVSHASPLPLAKSIAPRTAGPAPAPHVIITDCQGEPEHDNTPP
jgi:Flp pilus assembly protein TadD